MTKTFDIELKETLITYRVVQIDATDADEAQEIASERYESDSDYRRLPVGQYCYVDIVDVCES